MANNRARMARASLPNRPPFYVVRTQHCVPAVAVPRGGGCYRIPELPCIFPASREFGFRDEFAPDCPLQRGVNCEPVRAGGIQPGDPLPLQKGRENVA